MEMSRNAIPFYFERDWREANFLEEEKIKI